MSKTLSVESPRLKNRCRKSIRCSCSRLRCAVRFWSLESEFVFVCFHNLFFAAVRSRPLALHEKACGTGRPAGVVFRGHRARPPVEAGCGGREAGNAQQKNGFENITKRGAGSRCPCLSAGKLRSGAVARCVGADAQRERSEDVEHRSRSMRASKRNAAAFRLRDKLESGAA
jgi:hypothetical protein